MPNTPVNIETFYWKGQLRYKCPLKWESGAQCEYDTYDQNVLRAHMASPHTRTVGLKIETQTDIQAGKTFTKESDPEFESVRFMDTEI